ncbi:MAG: MqnA/MqnD/SBP family protein, partial [Bacteroidia bacterium]
MKISLGYSPCPNDCFIFDALVHGKIDTEGLKFTVSLDDVETLNQKALHGELDITKLSFHAYAYVMKEYVLLRAGSALGFNCGPLLVENGKWKIENVPGMKVAIPGKMTTANFLLSLA